MDARWQPLGDAAGAVGVGLNRVRVAPGRLPTPPHSHGASEELYFVLGGSGLVWQDEVVHAVAAGDCVIQRPDSMEHTFVAGADGLDYLVFGTRHPTEFGWLPRSRAVRIGWPWAEGRDDDPWDIEAIGPAAGDRRARPAATQHRPRRRGRAVRAAGRAHRHAGHPRALAAGRTALGAAGAGPDGIAPARALRGGGAVRDARRQRHPAAVAIAGGGVARQGPRGHRAAGRARGVAAARQPRSRTRSWPAPRA